MLPNNSPTLCEGAETQGDLVARTADFAVRVFCVAMIATVPYSIAVSKLRRPFLSDRYFFIALRFDCGPRENALRSARTNLIAPSRGRKDADHRSGPSPEGYGPQGGGPRYACFQRVT
jgi:hypothetical protein